MFGYMGAPCRACAGTDHHHYRQLFCGVCNVLARRYGLAARWLINRDSTALAVAWAAQCAAPPQPTLTTCCNPFGRARPICQEGAGVEFAAAATMVGLGLKLRDQMADGGWSRRTGAAAAQRLLGGALSTAASQLNSFGFDVAAVWRVWQRQLDAERELSAARPGTLTPREMAQAAQPTGALAARVLGHTAHLADRAQHAAAWSRMGQAVGETIYWLDAVDDVAADRRSGQFNPLLLAAPDAPEAAAREVLTPLLADLHAGGAALSPVRHHALVATIFQQGLTRRLQRLLVEPGDLEGVEDVAGEGDGRTRSRKRLGTGHSPARGQDQDWCDCGNCDCSGCQGCCDGVRCCYSGCGKQGDHDHGCCSCDGCSCDCCSCDGGGCDCCSCDSCGCDGCNCAD